LEFIIKNTDYFTQPASSSRTWLTRRIKFIYVTHLTRLKSRIR